MPILLLSIALVTLEANTLIGPEGIETREQEDEWYNYGQGYYFSRPLKSDTSAEFAKSLFR